MHIWMTERFLHLGMHWFQMGWSEDLSEPAKAASVLWRQQRHQGLRQVLQELAFLLDSWSWALCKSEAPTIMVSHPGSAILLPMWGSWILAYLFSRGIFSLTAGACWPALYRAEHDQQHNPVTSELVAFQWYAKNKEGFNSKQLGQEQFSIH